MNAFALGVSKLIHQKWAGTGVGFKTRAAHHYGVTPPTLIKVMTGHTNIKYETMLEWAERLDITLSELIRIGEDELKQMEQPPADELEDFARGVDFRGRK